jgi:L-ascorbate metabolism protein UlaG (beta-lactamase superfamily)
MRVRWHGQGAFLLEGERSVFVDPFGDPSSFAGRGIEFGYPPIEDARAELVLVTHEHFDHNGVEVVAGDPQVIRSTAGRFDSPVGEVVAIASEHDAAAGTQRGPNTIFCFTLDGLRMCHFGDFGQAALRKEQREAIGDVDVLFLPVGGGPTVGGESAAEVVRAVAPRLTVAMHFGTYAVGFVDPPDAFVDALGAETVRLDGNEFDPAEQIGAGAAVVVPAPPEPR